MLLDLRIKGVPLTFLIVLVLMIVLTIFFGAWAVSMDANAQNGEFAFGAAVGAGTGPSSAGSGGPPKENANGSPVNQEDNQSSADTWWGGALLKACPLH